MTLETMSHISTTPSNPADEVINKFLIIQKRIHSLISICAGFYQVTFKILLFMGVSRCAHIPAFLPYQPPGYVVEQLVFYGTIFNFLFFNRQLSSIYYE